MGVLTFIGTSVIAFVALYTATISDVKWFKLTVSAIFSILMAMLVTVKWFI